MFTHNFYCSRGSERDDNGGGGESVNEHVTLFNYLGRPGRLSVALARKTRTDFVYLRLRDYCMDVPQV